MNRVLITGITGKSGSFMLEKMIEHKADLAHYNFKVLVRTTSDTREIDESGLNIEKFYGNITEPESMQSFCQGKYDTLFHITGIHWSLIVVPAALNAGVKRIIVVHTTGIYSKYRATSEEYRRIEAKIRELCLQAGATITILRPTMIYGNLKDRNLAIFIKMVDKLRVFPTVNGAKYELQPVWCGDLGKAYYRILMNPRVTDGNEYTLSGGKPIMLIDMFKVIASQLNVKNVYISVPFWIAYSGAKLIYILTFGKKDMREKVQRLVEPRAFGHEEATKDFGYAPLDFQKGITSEIEEYIKARG